MEPIKVKEEETESLTISNEQVEDLVNLGEEKPAEESKEEEETGTTTNLVQFDEVCLFVCL